MDYVPLNSQLLQKKEGYRDILEYYLMFEFGFMMNWSEVTTEFKGNEKKLFEDLRKKYKNDRFEFLKSFFIGTFTPL